MFNEEQSSRHTGTNNRLCLRPKTTERMRRKTEQVFNVDSYCHANGKFYCHTKQTGLKRLYMLFKKRFRLMNKTD